MTALHRTDAKVAEHPSMPWNRAREIMGRNFFGVAEAIKCFKIDPSKQQLASLAEVPFSEEQLQSCKDSNVLVAVFPLSILNIRSKVDRKLFYSPKNPWYNKQAAREKGELGWQLVRKTPVKKSTNKTWNVQQALLSKDDETPTAQVVVYTIIGHFLSTGERLFENIYVRTSSVGSRGHHVYVGDFDAGGLVVDSCWDDRRYSYLGVSASRKF